MLLLFYFPFSHLGLFNYGKWQPLHNFICIWEQTFQLSWIVFVVLAPTSCMCACSLVHRCFFSRAGQSRRHCPLKCRTRLWLETLGFFPDLSVLSLITSCKRSTMCGRLIVTLHPPVRTRAHAQITGSLLIDISAGYSLTPNQHLQPE